MSSCARTYWPRVLALKAAHKDCCCLPTRTFFGRACRPVALPVDFRRRFFSFFDFLLPARLPESEVPASELEEEESSFLDLSTE